MKISNVGVSSTLPSAQQPADAIGSGSSQSSAPPGVANDTSAYSPSAELTHLVGLVQQQSDVRSDRVQAATQMFEQGGYLTPAAADQTAVAMLGSLE